MNNEFLIQNISSYVGKTVIVKGWVTNIRSSGALAFLQIRDGSGFMQATAIKSEMNNDDFLKAKNVTLETSVILEGTIKEEKRSPGGYEMTIRTVSIIQKPKEDYPISTKDHGPDFLLTHRHLWLRSKKQWAIQRIRNVIISSMYEHLFKEGFIKIDAPILTPNACEGTTTLFPVPYLPAWKDQTKPEAMKVSIPGEKNKNTPYAFLSQSGQLYIEAAIFAHRKVFDFGPTFRAEKSKTRRHLTEFWMMDAEMAFTDYRENMLAQEQLIVAVTTNVLNICDKELQVLERDTKPLENVCKGNFPVISHADAITLLHDKGYMDISERDDFGAEAETILSMNFDKPLFIEKYPKEVKAFYMKEDPNDPSRVLNDDLLAPEGYGEIIGGSEREDSYDRLLLRMKELEIPVPDYEWYLDLRKYGSVQHSGYGIGLERLVTWICKLDHLRESIPFPRMMERFMP